MDLVLKKVDFARVPEGVVSEYEAPVCAEMKTLGLTFSSRLDASVQFQDAAENLAILIDLSICRRSDLAYIDYTTVQNELMARFDR